MPELPEVETVRRDLEALAVGGVIESASLSGVRTARRVADPAAAAASLVGRRITGTTRIGKYLQIGLDDGRAVVVHLGMSGQLLAVEPGSPAAAHTHARIELTGGPDLRFVDPRTFGEVFVSRPEADTGRVPELAHLGVDPFDPALDRRRLRAVLAGRRAPLKAVLLGQRVVAGVGNMYADELLWTARLSPWRPAGDLSLREAGALLDAMRDVLGAAITARGSSLADAQYRDVFGQQGGYAASHNVYGREGLPCPRCSTAVLRTPSWGRSTFTCPRCQGGRVHSAATGRR